MDFSFVHAADLHLDSPFRGLAGQAPPSVADFLRSATFRAYDALIDFCIERRVAFLLVAGDVYDGADRSTRAQLRFRDGLARLDAAGIGAYVVHGNHDPLDGWSAAIEWPASARLFRAREAETFLAEIDGQPVAAVTGISHPARNETRNLAKKLRAERPDLFQIALLHCQCGSNAAHAPYAPCEPDELARSGFDYWALGHVHTRAMLRVDPPIIYPGNIQGLSIREPGPRGCHLVTVRDRTPIMKFQALDAARWTGTHVAIDSVETVDQLEEALSGSVDALRANAEGRPLIVRLRLTGHGPLNDELALEGAREALLERIRESSAALEPFVWIEKIEDRSSPALDLEARRSRNDLLGQLLGIADDLRGSDDALAAAFEPALADLHGHYRARRAVDVELKPEELRDILIDAERLCARLLEAPE